MKRFFSKFFFFAIDEDGFSLKDFLTVTIVGVWVATIIIGLNQDYSGEKLKQFTLIVDSVTDLTVYIVVSTLGLVATQSIASTIGKRGELVQKAAEIITDQKATKTTKSTSTKKAKAEKEKVNSADII